MTDIEFDKTFYIKKISEMSTKYGDKLLELMDNYGCTNLADLTLDQVKTFYNNLVSNMEVGYIIEITQHNGSTTYLNNDLLQTNDIQKSKVFTHPSQIINSDIIHKIAEYSFKSSIIKILIGDNERIVIHTDMEEIKNGNETI